MQVSCISITFCVCVCVCVTLYFNYEIRPAVKRREGKTGQFFSTVDAGKYETDQICGCPKHA